MAAFELAISVEGDEKLDNLLQRCGYRAFNAEPALAQVLEVFRVSEDALWSAKPWVANAPATLENKQSNEPLVRTGALERSLTQPDDKNQIVEITQSTLKFGTKLWYAHFALGTKTGEPKRDPIKIRAKDKRKVQDIIANWIVSGRFGGSR
jgi:hypothetical protein